MLVCTAAAIFGVNARAACRTTEFAPASAIILPSILFLSSALVSSRGLGARSSHGTSGAHSPGFTRSWPAKRVEITTALLAATARHTLIGRVGPNRLLQTACLFMEAGKSRWRASASKEPLIASWLHARTAFSARVQAFPRRYHRQVTCHGARFTPIAFTYSQTLHSRRAATKFFRPHSGDRRTHARIRHGQVQVGNIWLPSANAQRTDKSTAANHVDVGDVHHIHAIETASPPRVDRIERATRNPANRAEAKREACVMPEADECHKCGSIDGTNIRRSRPPYP